MSSAAPALVKGCTSYWLSAADHQADDEPDGLPSRATVVVIGGGLMGLATTYGLAQRGVDVVLLEAGRLAGGATGRNVGVFMPGGSPVEDVRIVEAVLRREGIEAAFRRCGHLALASTDEVFRSFESEVARRSPTAPTVKTISHHACEEVVGMRIDETVAGGRWMPGAHLVNPVALAHGVARAARRRGATIAPRTRATRVVSRRGGRHVVCTGRTTIESRHVVWACGSALNVLARDTPRLTAHRGQVLATEPMPTIFRNGMALDYGTVYWRQSDDGTVLLGGCRGSAAPGAEDTAEDGVTADVQGALEAFLPAVFPDLPPLRVRSRWSGTMDSSDDGRPIVGRLPGHPGEWVIAGFGGHGLPGGLGAGVALAAWIASGRSAPDLAKFDPARLLPQSTPRLTRA